MTDEDQVERYEVARVTFRTSMPGLYGFLRHRIEEDGFEVSLVGDPPQECRLGGIEREVVVILAVNTTMAVARAAGGQELLDKLHASVRRFQGGREARHVEIVEPDTILPHDG